MNLASEVSEVATRAIGTDPTWQEERAMISTVLVPLDGSPVAEQAIPYAQALLPDGGEVVLLRVVPELDLLLTELLRTLEQAAAEGATDIDGVLKTLEHAAAKGTTQMNAVPKDLEREATRIANSGLQSATEVARGDAAAQILRAIERDKVDLVVMTTHGRGAIGRTIFGSVADRVSQASPVPVLLVRPSPGGLESATADIRRLVVPLDGSELAEGALPVAVALAKRLRAQVRLVRAVELAATIASMNGLAVPSIPVSGEVYEQVLEAVLGDARGYLVAVAVRLEQAGVAATWAVLEGSPFFAIAEATETGDLVVLASHGRSGVMRWLMGSVAEKLVREAPVPVLLVPSAGRGTGAVGG